MVHVILSGGLKAAAGGKTAIDVEAANLQQMLARLGADHPKLKPLLDRGVSVSLNGQIVRDPGYQPIPPGSEIFILPKMAGG